MANFSNITNSAIQQLEKRTLGGVTRESAEAGIKQVGKEAEKIVTETERLLNEKMAQAQADINKVTAELKAELRTESTARTNAEFDLGAKTQEAKKLAEKSKARAHVKTLKTQLPDGREVTTRIYPKGGYVQRTKKPNGEVNLELVTPKGEMKSIKGAGKEITSIYDRKTNTLTKINNGVENKEIVNVKKVKAEKPRLVSQTKPEYTKDGCFWDGDSAVKFVKTYSDGSKETIIRVTAKDNTVRKTVSTLEKDGKCISRKVIFPNSVQEVTYHKDKTVARRKVTTPQITCETVTDYILVDDPLGKKQIATKSVYTEGNRKTTYTAIKDKLGYYTGEYTFVTKDLTTKKVIEKGPFEKTTNKSIPMAESVLFI